MEQYPKASLQPPRDKSFISRLRLDREKGLYLLLILIAAGMHFWMLDYRAIHHDESLHGLYSWYLSIGRGYQHNPMMHGPFQFLSTASIFKLFGASNYTLRLLPAIFGTALVGMPYFLRRQLGKNGSLITATLLALSPSILYFGRFARNDVYILMWTLIMIICIWRYIEKGKPAYLYGLAAALSLSFCTKENTFITVVILGIFLLIATAREWLTSIRNKFDFSHLSRPAELLLLLVTLTLPQCAAGISIFQHQLGVTLAAEPAGIPQGAGFIVAAATVVILLIIAALLGLRWNPKVWLISAAIFYAIYIPLFTTFFTNLPGLGSGMWCSLSYWLIQHGVERGGQPWYYYLVLLPTYEFLPLIFAIAGGIYYCWLKNNVFSKFLIYWAIIGLILYSWSGEKMPWLVVHTTLPLIMLGGMFVGRMLKGTGRARIVTAVFFSLLLVFTGWVSWRANYRCDDATGTQEMLVYAQGSQKVELLMSDIDRLAEQSSEGKSIKIVIDHNLTWPWAWYLRDYTNVSYLELDNRDEVPDASVLLITPFNDRKFENLSDKYGDSTTFSQIIWFPKSEYERDFNLLSLDSWKRGWDFFIHRKTVNPYTSSYDKIVTAYFPPGFTMSPAWEQD